MAQAADGDRSGRRQVLGSRKDPFKPQVTPTPTPKPDAAAPGAAATTTGSTRWRHVRRAPRPRRTTGTPVVPTPAKPKKTYELYELTVRFGPSADRSPRARTSSASRRCRPATSPC